MGHRHPGDRIAREMHQGTETGADRQWNHQSAGRSLTLIKDGRYRTLVRLQAAVRPLISVLLAPSESARKGCLSLTGRHPFPFLVAQSGRISWWASFGSAGPSGAFNWVRDSLETVYPNPKSILDFFVNGGIDERA